MNNSSQYPCDDTTDIKDALQYYPRLHASPDFNRRVFDAMENATQSPHVIDATLVALCDKLDHIFENRLLKLATTALLGIAISWACCQLAFPPVHQTSIALQLLTANNTTTLKAK